MFVEQLYFKVYTLQQSRYLDQNFWSSAEWNSLVHYCWPMLRQWW